MSSLICNASGCLFCQLNFLANVPIINTFLQPHKLSKIAVRTCAFQDGKKLIFWLVFIGLPEYVEPKLFSKSRKPCHTYPTSSNLSDPATGLKEDLAVFLKGIAKKSDGITIKGQKLEETI